MTDRRKGHIYVIGQFFIILLALISSIIEPRIFNRPWNLTLMIIGGVISAAGIAFMTASVRSFKQEITAHPMPREEYKLMTSGMYGIVRHPIYFSALVLVFGGVLLLNSYFSLLWVVILFIWFNSKATFEQGFLSQKFADYSGYAASVKKLIPYLY